MKYTQLTSALVFGLTISSLVGCGSGEPTAITEDELSQYLATHPDLVEAAVKADKEREELEKAGR